MEYQIPFSKKIKVVEEKENEGAYEIEELFPGYGYTLGHPLRRVILSSMPGAAITKIKIEGVSHEFSTIDGVKEDVINIILNLKQVRFKMFTAEPQTFTTTMKGVGRLTSGDLKTPANLEVVNKDLLIATLTTKDSEFIIETTVEKGLGYVPKETAHKEKVEVGSIALDASFTPVRKVNYEVENMRVGERTDYNRLKFFIETDGTIAPGEVMERAIKIITIQFKAMLGEARAETGFEEGETETYDTEDGEEGKGSNAHEPSAEEGEEDVLKIRIEDLDFSTRSLNALSNNGIRTVGGLVKKKEQDLLQLDGLGQKAIKEIRRALGKLGLSLKE